MPYFTQARNTNVYGGSFTDVRGDIHSYRAGGNISIQRGDPIIQTLFPATATGAAYNSQERYPPPRCHPGTRRAVLDAIGGWVASGGNGVGGGVMWLHGPAGAGKSAIAQTVCESQADLGQLAASFFFSRGHAPRDSMDTFFTTIAFQLAMSDPDLRNRIAKAVQDNPMIVHEATTTMQVKRLIVKPIRSKISRSMAARVPFLIVIDGLDECRGNRNQSQILTNIIDLIRKYRLPLYILVISRPEPHIMHIFDNAHMSNLNTLSLYGDHQADSDIRRFLEEGFEDIYHAERHSAIMKAVRKPWPPKHVIETLVQNSGGYFIYASTVLRFVDEEYCSPVERLNEVLNASPTSHTTAFAELDKLYAQILSASPKMTLLKRVLACILLPADALSSTGITATMIEELLSLQPGEVMLTLRGLHSLLEFREALPSTPSDLDPRRRSLAPETGEVCIKSLHASLADFVFNQERAGVFYVDMQDHHARLALRCWIHLTDWSKLEQSKILTFVRFRVSGGRPVFQTNFAYNFKSIQDNCKKLIADLESTGASAWAAVARKSKTWPVAEKHILLDAVEEAVPELKALFVTTPPVVCSAKTHTVAKSLRAIIQQLSSLTDVIYTVHLAPQTESDIQFICRIFNMFRPLRVTASELAHFLQLSQSIQPYWQDLYDYMAARNPYSKGSQLWNRPSFVDFMSDRSRCGDLFMDSKTCHTDLALCCMETLVTSTLDEPAKRYARKYLSKHLSQATAGDRKVLDFLRGLDLSSGQIRERFCPHALIVVGWLEAVVPRLSEDVLLPWCDLLHEQDVQQGPRNSASSRTSVRSTALNNTVQ